MWYAPSTCIPWLAPSLVSFTILTSCHSRAKPCASADSLTAVGSTPRVSCVCIIQARFAPVTSYPSEAFHHAARNMKDSPSSSSAAVGKAGADTLPTKLSISVDALSVCGDCRMIHHQLVLGGSRRSQPASARRAVANARASRCSA